MNHYSSKFKKPGEKVVDSNVRFVGDKSKNLSLNSKSSNPKHFNNKILQQTDSSLLGKLRRFWFIPLFLAILVFLIFLLEVISNQNILSQIDISNPVEKGTELTKNDTFRLAFLQIEASDDYKILTKLSVASISARDKTVRILDFPVSEEENNDSRLSRLRYFYEETPNESLKLELSMKLQIPIDRIILSDNSENKTFKFDNVQDFLNKIQKNSNLIDSLRKIISPNDVQRYKLQTDLSYVEIVNLQQMLANFPKISEKELTIFDTDTQVQTYMADSEILSEQARVEVSNSSDITGLGQKYAKTFSSVGILISKVSNFDKVGTNDILYVLNKNKYAKTLQIIEQMIPNIEVRETDPSKFSTADIFVILK